jgi:hypothetical protein
MALTARYNYDTPSGMNAPAAGYITHPTAATTQMRVNNVDADSQDNSAAFADLGTDDTITIGSMVWTITSATPGASYLSLNVAPAGQQQSAGEYTVSIGPQAAIRNVTILSGESLSNAFDASNAQQVFIGMPDDWSERAPLTFRYSPDAGVSWYDAVDAKGKELSVPVVKGGAMQVDAAIANKGWLKLRSGTRRYPVLQQADRGFVVNVIA